jgi:hypothetical protein
VIDRQARNRLAEGIRHLSAGLITNADFEDRVLSRSSDAAVQAVFLGGPWFLYHDIASYRLRGPHRLSPAVRREAARWILFLKSDLPYEWPVESRDIAGVTLRLVLNLLTFGALARHVQRRFAKHGEVEVWPFIRRSDYEAALKNPPYLGKPSNPPVNTDARDVPPSTEGSGARAGYRAR